MTSPHRPEGARALRSRLRAALLEAMKARAPEAVAALRTAIAAIDNAEAVPASADGAAPRASEHFAGARAGAGSTEADRRVLSAAEVRALLEGEISARVAAAERYEALGRPDDAGRLRREAEVLGRLLAP